MLALHHPRFGRKNRLPDRAYQMFSIRVEKPRCALIPGGRARRHTTAAAQLLRRNLVRAPSFGTGAKLMRGPLAASPPRRTTAPARSVCRRAAAPARRAGQLAPSAAAPPRPARRSLPHLHAAPPRQLAPSSAAPPRCRARPARRSPQRSSASSLRLGGGGGRKGRERERVREGGREGGRARGEESE